MIVDTSAVIAMIRNETEARAFAEALRRADRRRMSAASYLEAGVVIDSARDLVLSGQLDQLLENSKITIEAVSERQGQIARQAYREFGKGSGHPAQLNFGDCFSYALATVTGEPLLFKGDDFVHTDVQPAVELDI